MKIEAPEARKNHKTGTWSRLGESWSGSWRPGRDVLGISAHVGAKMGARWAKLAILGSTWEVVGRMLGALATILAHGLDSRKPTKTR